MPPNRFESEVESFLEGSHGDRTHIKRADHPRLHHYAGRYCCMNGLTGDSQDRDQMFMLAERRLKRLAAWRGGQRRVVVSLGCGSRGVA